MVDIASLTRSVRRMKSEHKHVEGHIAIRDDLRDADAPNMKTRTLSSLRSLYGHFPSNTHYRSSRSGLVRCAHADKDISSRRSSLTSTAKSAILQSCRSPGLSLSRLACSLWDSFGACNHGCE